MMKDAKRRETRTWPNRGGAFGTSMAWLAAASAVAGCANEARRPAGWSEATHGLGTRPDYALLFDADVVHSLEIAIRPSDYAAMQSNLAELLGDSPFANGGPAAPNGGGRGNFGGPLPGSFDGGVPDGAGGPGGLGPPGEGFEPPGGNGPLPPPGGDAGVGFRPGSGAISLLAEDPMYVPVEVRHDGHVWTRVGMRYKGNSSLAASGGQGKLPFRLDFDEYEDQHAEVDNQRFYGFDELTFASNWNDDSQLRECFATELLRDRGVPAARCAFYSIYIDVGNGREYWGLYSMIEDPSDAMIESQLGGGDGNLYKPDGPGADWTRFDREGFVKKTNESAGDWSDVEKAIAALHADRSDAAAWRRGLEATFDVERFLAWLAINTSMVNWDTYGGLAHNYYLYGAPQVGGKLQWIPWDHNLSMQAGGFGPRAMGGVTTQSARAEVFHENVGAEWPLISWLLSDVVYLQTYRAKLEQAIGGLFEEGPGGERLRALHAIIAPYVTGANAETETHTTVRSAAAFDESVDGPNGLIAHFAARRARVREALSAP
jgi:spore coat protein H